MHNQSQFIKCHGITVLQVFYSMTEYTYFTMALFIFKIYGFNGRRMNVLISVRLIRNVQSS